MVLLQISIAIKLVKNAKIEQRNIAILSPYNAQVSEIKEKMKEEGLNDITVTTFTKSQGNSNVTFFTTVNPL